MHLHTKIPRAAMMPGVAGDAGKKVFIIILEEASMNF